MSESDSWGDQLKREKQFQSSPDGRREFLARLAVAFPLAGGLLGTLAAAEVAPPAATREFPLASPEEVETRSTIASAATHQGRRGLRVIEAEKVTGYSGTIVKGSQMLDGAIEVELAGQPRDGSPEGARGFVGIAFRVQPESGQFEAFYLRPTNGRADDQLRRNHSTQYISHPGYPWHKLRAESPGIYESYVDLVSGAWTRVRIEVDGQKARLFVHGAAQPCLIVNDLKQAPQAGAVALWIGQGTEAFFRNLRVTPKG
jgi:hypothetical protein